MGFPPPLKKQMYDGFLTFLSLESWVDRRGEKPAVKLLRPSRKREGIWVLEEVGLGESEKKEKED